MGVARVGIASIANSPRLSCVAQSYSEKRHTMKKVVSRGTLPLTLTLLFYLHAGAQSRITTYAGPELPRTGRIAATEAFDIPFAVVPDTVGGFYFSSFYQDRVYRVTSDGIVTLVAGTQYGYGGDGGLATAARLAGPFGLALDAGGNLYIADYFNSRVRKVAPNGVIQTVAGNGT